MDDTHIIRQTLEELTSNLWWTWHPEVVRLLQSLDPDLWTQVNHSPKAFLKAIPDERLEERVRSLGLEGRLLSVSRRMREYLADADTWGGTRAGLLTAHPVAYFSAEFGLHESLPIYSGGLGILAGDHLKSASDLGIPVCGIGVFYAQGYFRQRLDRQYWQQQEFGTFDINTLPIEPLVSRDGGPLRLSVPAGEDAVLAGVWRVRVGRNHLLLLDTDVEGNKPEYREVTHRLYWGDQGSRIRQELILGIGGVRALKAAGIVPSVYHLNEGHSAFALLETIRDEMETNAVGFDEARHRVGSRSVFTTHTPVPAGHDRFPPDMMEAHLGWLRRALGLTREDFLALGRLDPRNSEEPFCMTVLALKVAQRANGVSSIHGDTSRRMWRSLWPSHATREVPIGHITNGVHVSSWIAPQVMTMLEKYLGTAWAQRLGQPEQWRNVRQVRDDEIWEIRSLLKSRLVSFVRQRYAIQEARRGRDPVEISERSARLLNPDHLTLGFARRFATYKRATLLLRHLDRLAALVGDEERPLQIAFAGKAHPRDEGGKRLIQEIAGLQEREPFAGRVVFIEDHDINVGRSLVHGVDVWVNTPRRPEEACGTSGMKAVLNGALNLSILDGWWAEAYDGKNGFAIRSPGPHADPAVQDERDAEALLWTLEEEVVPMYYQRDKDGLPREWLRRMKTAFMNLAGRYNSDRMVMEYAEHAYIPAAGGSSVALG